MEAIEDLWFRIGKKVEEEKKKWIESLRTQGIKAAHPYDGWVDRVNKTVIFSYPQFNDGADVGDKVMLGWSMPGNLPSRLVVLTGKKVSRFGLTTWSFEDANTA